MQMHKIDRESLASFLKSLNLFKGVKPVSLDKFINRINISEFRKGQTIIGIGAEGRELFFVFDGKVKAVLESDDHSEILLTEMYRGSYFGEMSLLTEEPVSSTIKADEESLILAVRKEDFFSLVWNDFSSTCLNLTYVSASIFSSDRRERSFFDSVLKFFTCFILLFIFEKLS